MDIFSADVLAWIHAIGLSLLHSLWQGVFIGAGYAAIRVFVPKARASVRHLSGLIALFLLAVSPMLTLWFLRPSDGALAMGEAVVESGTIAPAFTTLVEQASSEISLSTLLPAIVMIWAIGVVVCVLRGVQQWRALDRVVVQFSQSCDELDRMLQAVAQRFGEVGPVRVLISSRIDTPTLIGWLKPVILLPTAVAIGFPRHQLELILAHELGHLRRHDHLVNLAQVVVETVLFYHPVVHWISREVRHEREICCDQLVLRVTDEQPAEYARTLAALESMRQAPSQLALAATGGRLVDRVRRILGLPASSGAPIRLNSVRLVAALAVFVAIIGVAIQFERAGNSESSAEWTEISRPHFSSFAAPEVATLDLPQSLIEFSPVSSIAIPVGVSETAEESVTAVSNSGARDLAAEFVAQESEREAVIADVAPVSLGSVSEVASSSRPAIAAAPAVESVIAVVEQEIASPTPAITADRPSRSAPVLVRKIAPNYPAANLSRSKGHVEFEFAIDRDGRVRDIEVIAGDSKGSYAEAARRALRQWRFEPEVTGYDARRFQQDFVFIDRPLVEADGDESRCVRSTGSHICRPVRVAEGIADDVSLSSKDSLAMKGN